MVLRNVSMVPCPRETLTVNGQMIKASHIDFSVNEASLECKVLNSGTLTAVRLKSNLS